ncbi:MAG: Abi family protein [Mycoplasmatales bacterium]|nr:Abi family protein [Mycoplasmatales bacterium]
MNKKYLQENFLIENLSIKQTEKLIKRKSLKSDFWKWIVNKHEIKYICSYIGVLLLNDKTKLFMKGVKIYDLFNMYYMDFTIKNNLLIICQKIERGLKVSMLNETDGIFDVTKSKSFGSKIDFLKKKKLDEKHKIKVMKHFEKIVESKFIDLNDFLNFLLAVKRIRNFSAHSYNPAKHYDWHTEFTHHTLEKENESSFRNDFKQLMRGATNGTIKNLKNTLINLFEEKPFSNNEIGATICARYLGTRTIYSLEWDDFLNKPNCPFELNDFLKANSK